MFVSRTRSEQRWSTEPGLRDRAAGSPAPQCIDHALHCVRGTGTTSGNQAALMLLRKCSTSPLIVSDCFDSSLEACST